MDGNLVYLSSSNPAVASVPATTLVAEGQTLSPYFAINTFNVVADTNVVLSATYGGVTINAAMTVKVPVTVSGTISLQEIVDSQQNIVFTFQPTDGAPDFERQAVLTATGGYSFNNIPARQYTVHIKGDKWLARNIAVNATAGNVNNANASLLGGDANNDNSVDIFDLDLLIQAFNSVEGDPNFLVGTDLNCDGAADVFDLNILITNFNSVGDPLG
jgi:hypothetical protein